MRISDWSSDVCSSDLLARLRLHGPVVERAPAGEDFPSQKDIRGRVDIIGERQRLVDGLDAMSLGFRRMMDLSGLAIDADVSGIRPIGARQDLDESRLDRKSVVSGKSV